MICCAGADNNGQGGEQREVGAMTWFLPIKYSGYIIACEEESLLFPSSDGQSIALLFYDNEELYWQRFRLNFIALRFAVGLSFNLVVLITLVRDGESKAVDGGDLFTRRATIGLIAMVLLNTAITQCTFLCLNDIFYLTLVRPLPVRDKNVVPVLGVSNVEVGQQINQYVDIPVYQQ